MSKVVQITDKLKMYLNFRWAGNIIHNQILSNKKALKIINISSKINQILWKFNSKEVMTILIKVTTGQTGKGKESQLLEIIISDPKQDKIISLYSLKIIPESNIKAGRRAKAIKKYIWGIISIQVQLAQIIKIFPTNKILALVSKFIKINPNQTWMDLVQNFKD